MKIGCGTDIIKISRIEESIEKHGRDFIDKVYTDYEFNYCESKQKIKFQHFAARFAAKEAIYKAISNFDETTEADFLDVEIINAVTGKPKVRFLNGLTYLNEYTMDLSISHCEEYAVATAVIVLG